MVGQSLGMVVEEVKRSRCSNVVRARRAVDDDVYEKISLLWRKPPARSTEDIAHLFFSELRGFVLVRGY